MSRWTSLRWMACGIDTSPAGSTRPVDARQSFLNARHQRTSNALHPATTDYAAIDRCETVIPSPNSAVVGGDGTPGGPHQSIGCASVSLRPFPQSYWKYLMVTALFGLGNSSTAFLIRRAQDIGASLEPTILIYAAFNLVAALISYPAGSLSDSWGRKHILLISFVIFLIAYLGFAMAQDVFLVAALIVFHGFYQGIFRAVGKAFASDFVPEHLRASVVAGLLWDRIGHSAVFYYGAVFAALGTIALLLLIPGKHEPRNSAAVAK